MEGEASSTQNCQLDVFESWGDLLRHLKIHVLQNLPYPTLRNFMFLSKECFQLASEIGTEAFAVFLHDITYLKDEDDEDNEYNSMEEGTVELSIWYIPPHLRNVPNSFEPYQLLFTRDRSGGCILRRVREGTQHKSYGKEVRYAEETTFAAALRSFFQLTKNITAKELSVEVERLNPDFERALKQQTTARFSCKTFLIRTEDRALPPLLYPFIPAGCSLQVYTFPFPKPDDIFIESSCFHLELMRAAPMFDTEANVGVTDEQLPHLRGHRLAMKAPFISSKGVHEILMQWVEGRRRIAEVDLNQTRNLDKDEIFEGLDEYILSGSELRDAVGDRLGGPTLGVISRVGIRNKLGQLIVVTLRLNRCNLFDPSYNDDEGDC